MKNLSLILNAVLLVAVGVLFYLHFSAKKSTTRGAGTSTAATAQRCEDSLYQLRFCFAALRLS